MSTHVNLRSAPDYREWQFSAVVVNGLRVKVATKPGVFSHGRVDESTMLLSQHVNVPSNGTLVYFNCGGGLLGVLAELQNNASRVYLVDRNVVSAEAAKHTVVENELQRTQVLVGAGSIALPPGARADVVAIRVPHEKLALLQLLFDAFNTLERDGTCYIAGATNEGAKSAEGAMKKIFGNARVVAHDSGHRIVMSTKRTEAPVDADSLMHPLLDASAFHEANATLREQPIRIFTRPGVFSWDHVDEATALLAATMEVSSGESVLDLGCGAGALGVAASRLSATGRIAMLDADSEAIRSAHKTATHAGLSNFRALASDVALAVRDENFDVVVTNPPFHTGKATDLNVPLQFIEESWEVLRAGGRLYLVANRTLPYERVIHARFGDVQTLHDGKRFKILSAHKAG